MENIELWCLLLISKGLLVAIIVSLVLPLTIPPYTTYSTNTSINPNYIGEAVEEVYKTFISITPSYEVRNALLKAYQYREINPSYAWQLLTSLLTTDNDKDGLPDLQELYDGYNPFNAKSFGGPDIIDTAREGPTVDGFLAEWLPLKYFSHIITSIHSSLNTSYPGTIPDYLLATIKDDRLYVAVNFTNPPSINTSQTLYYLFLKVGDSIVKPLSIASFEGVEACFDISSINAGDITIVLKIIVEGSMQEIEVGASIGSIPKASLRKSWLAKYRSPLYMWDRGIPSYLPWYPLLVYGDNRPADCGAVEFDQPFLDNLRQFYMVNPIAYIGTGDHVGLGRRDQIDEFLALLVGYSNMWVVAGNHDWSYSHADKEYWETMVAPNLYYRDDIPGWRIVYVNGFALYSKIDPEKVEQAIENTSRNVILVFHVPPLNTGYHYPDEFTRQQMDFLRNLIGRYSSKIKLVLTGHWHVWRKEQYKGTTLVITGGGGAPLSSPKAGLPIYHYTMLILMPNGTYKLLPIATYKGSIDVSIEPKGPLHWVYTIVNTKDDVYGNPVALPIRLERYVKGVDTQVFLYAPHGEATVEIYMEEGKIIIEGPSTSNWYAIIGGKLVYPENNKVSIPLDNGASVEINEPVVRNNIIYISAVENVSSPITLTYHVSYDNTELWGDIAPSTTPQNYSISIHVLRDGNYSIEIYTSNGFSIKEYYLGTRLIDIYPPTIKVKNMPMYISKGVINGTVEATDITLDKIEVYLDGQLYETKTCSLAYEEVNIVINTTALSEGAHSLKIVAKDSYGHSSTYSVNIVVDREPPQITFIGPDRFKVSQIEETIGISVNDPNIDKVYIYVNGTLKYYGESRGSYPLWQLAILSKGVYNLTIVAVDKAGNKASLQHYIYVGLTTTPTTTSENTKENLENTSTYTGTVGQNTIQPLQPILIAGAAVAIIAVLLAITLYRRKKR